MTLLESVNSLVKQRWLVFGGLVSISVSMTPLHDSTAANPTAAELESHSRAALPFDEEVAPLGTSGPLSDPQLRYCLAQIIRIDAVRPILNRFKHDQVDYFNALVADFNTRCGHFSYPKGALEGAKQVVEGSRAQIESAAREAYRARFGKDEKSAIAGSKADTTSIPQPKPQAAPATPSANATPQTNAKPEAAPANPRTEFRPIPSWRASSPSDGSASPGLRLLRMT